MPDIVEFKKRLTAPSDGASYSLVLPVCGGYCDLVPHMGFIQLDFNDNSFTLKTGCYDDKGAPEIIHDFKNRTHSSVEGLEEYHWHLCYDFDYQLGDSINSYQFTIDILIKSPPGGVIIAEADRIHFEYQLHQMKLDGFPHGKPRGNGYGPRKNGQ